MIPPSASWRWLRRNRRKLWYCPRDVPPRQRWAFRTKLELAAQLVTWAAGLVSFLGRAVRVAADGAYAKRPFLRATAAARVAVVSRMRKDAALRTVPRPPTYGPGRISLASRAGQGRGWRVVRARQYGAVRQKRVKTFLATWRPAGGVIRVVIVREQRGWLALFSTDPSLTTVSSFQKVPTPIQQPGFSLEGWVADNAYRSGRSRTYLYPPQESAALLW
jgi:hypothetical protein